MNLTKNTTKFKGEIETYLRKRHNHLDLTIDKAFTSLKIKTCLCRANIIKKDGYDAAHLLLMLTILPILKIKTVHSFYKKHWLQWSKVRKDTFYRFKENTNYCWRTFFYKDRSIHVICRLKNSKVEYEYNGKVYQLCDLYQKVKHQLKKDQRTGLKFSKLRKKFSPIWLL